MKTPTKMAIVVAVIACLAVAYLAISHRPGLSIYVENLERRALLEACLKSAEVAYDVQPNNYFKAHPESVIKMQIIWVQFQESKISSPDQCKLIVAK